MFNPLLIKKLWLTGLSLSAIFYLSGCAEVINATTSTPIEMKQNSQTMGSKLTDQEIETVATVNIKKADPQLEHAHVNVDSFNGIVLLTGQIPTEELKKLAADTVYQLNPVREIHNALVVGDATNFSARSQDTWITTKLKTRLLADSDIKSRHVRIITEMNTVYLMGMVTREEAEKIVEEASHTSGVKQVVKVFEYLN